MVEFDQSLRQPKWKDWLRRFWNGYKFSNLGFKRLFIVGLVGVPLLANIISWQIARQDTFNLRPFTFEGFLGITVVSLLAYLIDFRVARWAYGGFSITWVKRLFIIAGVVVVPLGAVVLVASGGHDRDYFSWSYIGDFVGAVFPTLFAYLMVVRVARWVSDGFAATDRAQNGSPPNPAVSPEPARNQQTPEPPPEPPIVRRTPTAWLRFWTGIRLPLGGVVGVLCGFSIISRIPVSQVGNTVVFICLGYAIAGISLGILAVAGGLHQGELWAWKANMIIIFAEPVLAPLTKLQPESTGADLFTALITTVILWGVWSLPNYIYFAKRKSLFTT